MNALLLIAVMSSGLCDRIDRYLAPLQSLDVFSGVVLLARHDSILCERAYGKASIELNVPMTIENRFRIASVSKPFTAALLGVLADQGKLALSDSIARWLPDFPYAETITIEMLLQHRAGVPSRNSIPYDEESLTPNTLAALVDSIARQPLDYVPGTARRYSNGGFAVLARIAELIEHDDYARILEREVLKPLGLKNTAHENDGDVVPLLAGGYMPSAFTFGVMVRAPFQQMATKTGGGSLVSDAHDLLRFTRAVGNAPLLDRATWARLFPRKDGVLAWQGRSPGYNLLVYDDEKTGVTAIVLSNNYAAAMVGDIAGALVSVANDSVPAPLPITAPEWHEQKPLREGTYLSESEPITIRKTDSGYVAYLGNTPYDVLLPQPGGKFLARAAWSLIEFAGDSIRVSPLYSNEVDTAYRVQPVLEAEVYAAVLKFFKPAPNQVRWISADTIGEAMVKDLVERAGKRFYPYSRTNDNRSGGLLKLSRIDWVNKTKARVNVQFKQIGPYYTGPVTHLSFVVELIDGKWRAERI